MKLLQSILPASLKGQFNLALAALMLLLVASQFLSIRSLNDVADTVQQLSEERLTAMEQGQLLVRAAVLIEKEVALMQQAPSFEERVGRYNRVLGSLKELDKQVNRLGQASIELSIIEFQKNAQLFRGTVHTLASMHEQLSQKDKASARNSVQYERFELFNRNLLEQSRNLMSTAETLSEEFSRSYRQEILALTENVSASRKELIGLLIGSLFLAWLISAGFLDRTVISRLRKVSAHLRTGGNEPYMHSDIIPVSGDDEIAQMARAVELYVLSSQELVQAREEAAQSARFVAVGQLAAGIAHEINTPTQYVGDNLKFIRTVTREMANDPACNSWRDDFEEMEAALSESLEGLQHISSIVISMKEFSHPGVTEHMEADINKALDIALTVSQSEWKNVAIVEKYFDPKLPYIFCDLARINQVFLNLIVNAAQAIEEAGKPHPGKIVIKTGVVGGAIEVRISDSGCGISQDVVERVFDPFFTTKEPGKGTGQGLALCRDIIVNKHYGSIEVKGNPGDGAEFVLRLPSQRVDTAGVAIS